MFSDNEVCYECGCIVIEDRECLELTTWVYLGFVKRDFTSTDCDVPYHFHRFAKLDDYFRWKQDPDSELPHIYLTTETEIRLRFFNRQEMVDSVFDWHQYLLETDTT